MFSVYLGITIFTTECAEVSTGAWGVGREAWGVRGERTFESDVCYCKPHGGGKHAVIPCINHTPMTSYLPPFNVDNTVTGSGVIPSVLAQGSCEQTGL